MEATCRKFLDDQYHFGIGVDDIIELTGMGEDNAKSLIDVFSRNSSQQYVDFSLNLYIMECF